MRLICLLLLAAISNAGHPTDVSRVRFGPEFTFEAEDYENLVNYKHMAKIHLIENQPEGAKFKQSHLSDEALVSPNGWWFEPTRDNHVIEVGMSPMTVDEWKRFSGDIQDAVFVTAYNLNLWPALYLGGGHINIDLKLLIYDPLLLRNFIVDFWNHNELALGIFNYDTHNSISLSLLDIDSGYRIQNLIEEFDLLLNKSRKPTKRQTKKWLNKISGVLSASQSLLDAKWHANSRGKRIDLNFGHIGDELRLEMRAVRPQKDIQTWIHQISLLRDRLKYLSRKRTPIPISKMVPILHFNSPDDVIEAVLTPPVDPQVALKSFYLYVTESKQAWENHRSYIWPAWITDGELKRFERSAWFKAKQKECDRWL